MVLKFPISNYQFPMNFQLLIYKSKINWRLESGDWKFRKGFTLIELLVVISIIGVLATLISANLNSARSRARDAARKSDLRNIATALRLYYNDTGSYPNSNSSKQIVGCSGSPCAWGSSWIVGPTTYITLLPKDPLPNQSYKYEADSTNDTYTLSSCLENKSDINGVATSDSSWCPSLWQFQVKP